MFGIFNRGKAQAQAQAQAQAARVERFKAALPALNEVDRAYRSGVNSCRTDDEAAALNLQAVQLRRLIGEYVTGGMTADEADAIMRGMRDAMLDGAMLPAENEGPFFMVEGVLCEWERPIAYGGNVNAR